MSVKNGIVHLWDLPEDKVFVKLPKEVQKEMIIKALEFVKNEDELADILNTDQATVNEFKWSKHQSVNLKFLKRLCAFLCEKGLTKISLKNLEKQVELIKIKVGFGIKNPKFPLNFNCIEGSRVVSGFFFDGGIRKRLAPFYVNNEKYLINRMINGLRKVVGDIRYLQYIQHKTIDTFFVDFSPILGIILNKGLDMPAGKKVFTNPSIPEFILNGNREIKKTFLQQAFDDEGTVNLGQGRGRGKRIQLSQNHLRDEPPRRLTQLKELTEIFNISVTGPFKESRLENKRGYISYRYAIEITNQSDLTKFAKEINFSLETKKQKLQNLLNSYVLPPRNKRGIIYTKVLKACKELKDKNQRLTNKSIAKQLKKSESYVRRLMLKIIKERKLKIVKGRIYLGGCEGSTKREFDLTK